ncbi:hypothetical protein [Acinetobacter sp. WZC-1]|uniref:hypothetical protein n=1 Tax=Acinetobacter sp. WZC-1 TaxID=3459034 RepID=UPI00403D8083
MSLTVWILLFCINSLCWKWIISWGGAEVIKGWAAGIFFDWLVSDLNAEQIRAYSLLVWIGSGIWFIFGLFVPEVRFYNLNQ